MKKKEKIKAWWVRNGNEGFLLSNVYMNKQNAELVCKGQNLPSSKNVITNHKVKKIEINY